MRVTFLKHALCHGLIEIILQGLWNATSVCEGQAAIEIPQKTTLEVAETIATAESEGVQVDWIDREIGKILKAKDHQRFAQSADQLRERVAVLQRQLDEVAGKLRCLEALPLRTNMLYTFSSS